MRFQIRRFLVAATALWCLIPAQVQAQVAGGYPSRPVTLVVPFATGAAADAVARSLADALRTQLGQPVIVDNRPGAGGNIAAEYVARAAPDGYTLLMGGSSMTMSPALTQLRYDPVKDFSPVSQLLALEFFLEVRQDLPVHTLKELIAYLKAHPGQLSYGSAGNGSVTQLQMELFKAMADVHAVHIPYRGNAPALQDLLAGNLQMLFDSLASSGSYLRNGTLRPLAVAMDRRSRILPDVPTFAEAGLPGYDATAWTGVLAPAGTPRAVIDKLHGSIIVAIQDPMFRKRVESIGGVVAESTPEQFSAKLRTETAKWAKLAKERGLKAD
jgi:tripartite-type tricarboxylate transporter receptor subunit TctC